MIRTINELYRSYRRLLELAKRAPIEKREKLLKLARLGLKLAQVQLSNPSHRPDTRLRLSADQYRAIAEGLSAKPEMAERARWFAGMVETAERLNWPCSATAPHLVLTPQEIDALSNAPFWTRQRVFAPYLTKTELASLKQHAKEMHDLGQMGFADYRAAPDQRETQGTGPCEGLEENAADLKAGGPRTSSCRDSVTRSP
jgi:hypothetical protein